MFIAITGRQQELSLAELRAVFGDAHVTWLSNHAAAVATDTFDINDLGGTVKCGKILHEISAKRSDKASLVTATEWIIEQLAPNMDISIGKITFGVSAYGLNVTARDVQKTGILLKDAIKKRGGSLRLLPNNDVALSTATSHNNKLGANPKKREIFIVKTHDERIIIADGCGVQNITAYARRDRDRPRRDAFVGMLPPKLAQMMVNMAAGVNQQSARPVILDPFCGTGTVLQEALLRGYDVMGTDLNPKMIAYTKENVAWLRDTFATTGNILTITQGDAMTHQWNHPENISAVVCETYLGQPFSAPPKPEKLREVVGNCNHIITNFLLNIHDQLQPGTPLCIAVPSWQSIDGHFTRLPLIRNLQSLGYAQENTEILRYHRSGQVVARDILLLRVI